MIKEEKTLLIYGHPNPKESNATINVLNNLERKMPALKIHQLHTIFKGVCLKQMSR